MTSHDEGKAHMSTKTFSVEDILWAFIENADDARRSIGVSMAGTPWGYVRIRGPSGHHQVVIERYNASVAVEKVHSTLPGVELRPATRGSPATSSKKIIEHPLGFSVAPEMGKLLWGISAENLAANYASLTAFVEAIVRACPRASPW